VTVSVEGWAIVDGRLGPLRDAVLPLTDPGVTLGWSVFETLRARDGVAEHLDAHLDRLGQSCDASLIPMPARQQLHDDVAEVARRVGGVARIRITLTGGGHRAVHAEPLDPSRLGAAVRAVRGSHRDEPFLGGGVKHGSRGPWVVGVRRSGVDEVLLVDRDDRFTEATTAAIVAVIDGVVWSAPEDGGVLPSTTCALLLDRARGRGVEVRRERPPASGPWDGLYVTSVVRALAPIVELDGCALPGWDPVGRALAGG
jgi:branched-subunit amino acid aminotransferase/4-amino-4-deoxychorismate lyase